MRVPQDHFVTVNGVRLHYVDWGGDGRPLAFFHANGFHARIWDPIARALGRRFRVVALDMRGHGDSDKPEEGYAWEVFVADVIAFAEALGLRGAVGAGHSFGATSLAAAAGERPDLFERLALVEMVLCPQIPDWALAPGKFENPMAAAARRRRHQWPSREAVFENYRVRPPFNTWREESLRLYIEHGTEAQPDGGFRLKCPSYAEAGVFEMSPYFATYPVLERLRVPTLFVYGERSDVLGDGVAAEVSRRLEKGRILGRSGATHFLPMEEPEWVAGVIRDFADANA